LSPGSYAYIILTTGPEGFTDYSFDFGYTACGVVTTIHDYEGCQGDGYMVTVGSTTYDEDHPIGSDTLLTVNGCDSIVLTELSFLDLSGLFSLRDTSFCASGIETVSAEILDDTTMIIDRLWTDLGLGTSSGYTISDLSNDTMTIDAFGALAGTIVLEYEVSTMYCQYADTMIVQILAEPICEIISDIDTLCNNMMITLTAEGEPGDTYVWSTGDTTQSIDVSPAVTTSYQVTVTASSGCTSSCDKTIHVGSDTETEILTYTGCSGDGYSIEVNNITYDESNPSDTLIFNNMTGCDSIIIVDLTFQPNAIVEAGMPSGPICSNTVVDLSILGASISGGASSGVWTSIGGGIFNNNGTYGGANPATTYTPSEEEINQGVVILTLTSNDPPGPCEPEADAVMILINDVRCAQFPWVGGF